MPGAWCSCGQGFGSFLLIIPSTGGLRVGWQEHRSQSLFHVFSVYRRLYPSRRLFSVLFNDILCPYFSSCRKAWMLWKYFLNVNVRDYLSFQLTFFFAIKNNPLPLQGEIPVQYPHAESLYHFWVSCHFWNMSATLFTSVELRILAPSLRCWVLGSFSHFPLDLTWTGSAHSQGTGTTNKLTRIRLGGSYMSKAPGFRCHHTFCLSIFKPRLFGGL